MLIARACSTNLFRSDEGSSQCGIEAWSNGTNISEGSYAQPQAKNIYNIWVKISVYHGEYVLNLKAQIFADFGKNLSDATLHVKSGGCVLNAQIFADFGEKLSA